MVAWNADAHTAELVAAFAWDHARQQAVPAHQLVRRFHVVYEQDIASDQVLHFDAASGFDLPHLGQSDKAVRPGFDQLALQRPKTGAVLEQVLMDDWVAETRRNPVMHHPVDQGGRLVILGRAAEKLRLGLTGVAS